jgi:hypothetical protein
MWGKRGRKETKFTKVKFLRTSLEVTSQDSLEKGIYEVKCKMQNVVEDEEESIKLLLQQNARFFIIKITRHYNL